MRPYHGNNIMSIKIPYMRKETSTLLVFFAAAILMLLLSSPALPLSNPFLQPVQAQTTSLSFRTVGQAVGSLCTGEQAYLTFDAQGTTSSGSSILSLTGGTFQI